MQPNDNRRQSYDSQEARLRQMHLGIKEEYAKLLQNERRIWIEDKRVKYEDIEAAIITYFCQNCLTIKAIEIFQSFVHRVRKMLIILCKVINEKHNVVQF